MFQIVTGPFHPVLESSLVDEVRELKSDDPLTSLAIVVPSEILRRRLQWLLCVEQGLSLFDVHFLTFHQLALRLYHEQACHISQEQSPSFTVVSDLFFRQLIGEIVGREPTVFQLFLQSQQSSGFSAALWSTIRDLNEAMVDSETVLQGINEGLFETDAQPGLQALFLLQAKARELKQGLQIGNADDLATLVNSWITQSPFLARFGRVCYYGFYDLTQVQLSLFEAVTKSSRVTVYMPLVADSSFTFAQRFFDRHLSSGVIQAQSRSSSVSGADLSRLTIKVMNAVGPEDELILVCKEIGNLIELHGYTFDQIGVVARSCESYQPWISRLFEQHRIPFTSSAVRPLIQEPAIKLLRQLATLRASRFSSNEILDVMRSPYFRLSLNGRGEDLVHPELWEEIVQEMGITRGMDQWLRLSRVLESDISRVWERVGRENHQIPSYRLRESVRFFHDLVHQLIADCQRLPTYGPFKEHTKAYREFVEKYFLPTEPDNLPRGSGGYSSRIHALSQSIQELFAQLKEFDVLGESISWEGWTDVYFQVIEESSVQLEPHPHHGVWFLDAMAARGLPFRAMFIIGLNEQVFPRYIREDAFLRDRHRRVLAETLGYKIDEKLAGYDEEQLLFSLLQQATKDRLFLSYQRADENGRPLVPSSFLRNFSRENGIDLHEMIFTFPRRFSDRLTDPLFRDSLLTAEEHGLKLIVDGFNPSELLGMVNQDASIFQQGWNVLFKYRACGSGMWSVRWHGWSSCRSLGRVDRKWGFTYCA